MSREDLDVVVVGGGPAGLAAALALNAAGVSRVAVLEREDRLGGATRHCGHPTFGLREFGRLLSGPAYAERLALQAETAGIDVRLGHTVVRLTPGGGLLARSAAGLYEIGARRVLLATGARETPRSARLVSGERPLGVMNTGALQAHIYLEGLKPFSRPVVVGTELVGQSALWTCLSHGIRPAAVIEQDRRSTVPWPLGLFPNAIGVPVFHGARIVSIDGHPTTQSVVVQSSSGEIRRIACDGVVLTGCFTPETALLRDGDLEIDRGGGGAAVDQYSRCSDPAYFASGNLLRGIETAAWCFREGSRAGRLIAEDLAGRLPAPGIKVPILRGEGVKLTSPQILAFPLASASQEPIQVRADRRVSGRLCVRASGDLLWTKRMTLAPERRILVPTDWLPAAQGCASVTIGVE